MIKESSRYYKKEILIALLICIALAVIMVVTLGLIPVYIKGKKDQQSKRILKD
jgi:hypothetical protein